ncbi:hypothetical protein K503DRAFT_772570, partial [Rhizopogon vinicolor AM-OR11-026]
MTLRAVAVTTDNADILPPSYSTSTSPVLNCQRQITTSHASCYAPTAAPLPSCLLPAILVLPPTILYTQAHPPGSLEVVSHPTSTFCTRFFASTPLSWRAHHLNQIIL